MRSITKRFGDVVANDDVDLTLGQGEIHALVGENGSGKSTLMNQLAGRLTPDAGEIKIFGKVSVWNSPLDAIAAGIGMVHQHFQLVPTLTVTENVLLGEATGFRVGRRKRAEMARELVQLGENSGLGVDPTAIVEDLSVGQQQQVEILRALRYGAKVLVLDEPTANLAPPQVEQLLNRLRAMAKTSMAIVLITHHLDEVIEAASLATVLRQGRVVATVQTRQSSPADLARLMVGREVSLRIVGALGVNGEARSRSVTAEPPLLEGQGIGVLDAGGVHRLQDVSFAVAPGEVVAIAGVEGNGQDFVERVVTGLLRPTSGGLYMKQDDVTGATPDDLRRRGMAIVPSDRYKRGLIREMTVAYNTVLDRLSDPPYGHWTGINRQAVNASGRAAVDRYDIRTPTEQAPVAALSGGNAQKVVLARALSIHPEVLILGQPTRGLDVAATEFVWKQVRAARDSGTAVLLISTDIEEVLGLADRAVVLFRGRVTAALVGDDLAREQLGRAMGGLDATQDNE